MSGWVVVGIGVGELDVWLGGGCGCGLCWMGVDSLGGWGGALFAHVTLTFCRVGVVVVLLCV